MQRPEYRYDNHHSDNISCGAVLRRIRYRHIKCFLQSGGLNVLTVHFTRRRT